MKIQAFLKSLLFLGFLVVSLWGCSFIDRKESVSIEPGKKEDKATPVIKALPRELGSLWKDDSSWVDFYAGQSSRAEGEVIFIKPDDKLRNYLSLKVQKSSPDEIQLNLAESSSLVATINEVHPRKIYSFSALFKFQWKKKEYEATLKGKVKDQDINNEDSVLVDRLLDLDVTVRSNETRDLAKEDSEMKKEDLKTERTKENG